MLATNIDEVLAQLEALIDDCVKTDNRIGYFAALYFKVTSRIKQGIMVNLMMARAWNALMFYLRIDICKP